MVVVVGLWDVRGMVRVLVEGRKSAEALVSDSGQLPANVKTDQRNRKVLNVRLCYLLFPDIIFCCTTAGNTTTAASPSRVTRPA